MQKANSIKKLQKTLKMARLVNISIDWTEKFQFIGSNDKTDKQVMIDAPSGDTAESQGTTPKQLFLQGMASCTAAVVISLLEKMRAEMPTKFKIDVSGELTNEHPMYFKTIDITYTVEGNTKEELIKKAIQMSEEKYCGLTYMLREVATFNTKIIHNGKEI